MPRPGRIRIIGGSLRGSKIDVPHSQGLRPTPDRVRETLFNWLQPVVNGARCLDLFAGSGANGIEAMSRGAAELVLVERESRLARGLRDLVTRLKLENVEVQCADALAWLKQPGRPFDLVFMDPPFAQDLAPQAARRLEDGGWLAPMAMIYMELPADREADVPPNWEVHRQGRAGALGYTLYQRRPLPPATS
ncbi:MAG: 16S rRNA (guanine(966)-N(2))-methyltransferase RsmD [Rhodanobacteraceae bacterium]